MLKAVITGERQSQLVEAADPHAKENWAVVKVRVTPMCTEYKAWKAGQKSEFLGHEAVGEVVEVAQPGRVKVGDRVVVQPQFPCGLCALCVAGDYIHCEHTVDVKAFMGSREGTATYAQYVVKPDWLLSPIPDEVSDRLASLALCGLGPTFGGFELMRVDAFDTVLVTGLGPVGQGGVLNAKYRGARVVAADPIAWRRNKAEALGADVTLDPTDPEALSQIMEFTGGVGVDAALDCSGMVPAQRLGIDAARRKGQVTFVGECSQEVSLRASQDMIRKGLTVRGSWHYNLSLYPKIMQIIQSTPQVAELITHELPMSQVQEAFEISAGPEHAKILLDPWA